LHAGITPFFNSPEFSKAIGSLGGGTVSKALTSVNDFTKTPLVNVSWTCTLGSYFVAGAIGEATTAGVVAAVTGEDDCKAATWGQDLQLLL
jgi:hypothetical protein